MGRTAPFEAFPFVGPSSGAISPNIDAERAINLYYEPQYQGAHPALIGTPGLSAPIATLGSTPVRGLYAGNGRLFAVGGTHFYEVNPAGGIIQDYGAMPGSLGTPYALCQMQGNGIQFMVCDATAGKIYFVDTVGHTMVAEFNAYAMTYLDGFFVALATGASLAGSNPNQINVSAFNDGTTWPALAFAIKEGSADAIVQIANVNNLLWLFGQKNTEIWYNAGLPNFPFARVNGGTLNVGCLARQSVVNVNNTVMWIGADDRGWSRVYMAQGFQPVPVSTPRIESFMNALLLDVIQVSAFAYSEAGHLFYVLNFNSGNGDATQVYDLTTKTWHERGYWDGAALHVSRAQCFASVMASPGASTPQNFVGDNSNGNIYKYGLPYTSDNGQAIQRKRTCSHITDGGRWIKYPFFEVEADIGTAAMTLAYSNNGGRTFPPLNRPDATKTGSNDQGSNVGGGTYPRYKWWQCGRARKRTFQVTITDANNPIRLVNGWAGVGAGTEK